VTSPLRRATPALSMTLALMLAACATASPAPTASPGPSTGAPATETAAPSATRSSGVSPAASATTSPSASALACPVTPQTGLLPSDRLVDLAISSTPTQDLLTFVFAAPSSPSPAGPARGTLDAAKPPFSFAGSGLPIDLLGQHAVQIRFSGMTIASESGEATYHGPVIAKPHLVALREAVQFDASEGIVGWYVGYDGPGCVALVREGNDVTVSIAHPEAPAG
jgi:ABC-type amino acid transport substrate-binding protein